MGVAAAAGVGRRAEPGLEDAFIHFMREAQDNADKRTVTAPVGGLVTVLNAQNGQSLSGGGSSSASRLPGCARRLAIRAVPR